MADDVAFYGEVPDVDLHLAGYQQAVGGARPLRVEILELGNGRVVVGGDGEGFLHGAFHEAVGEDEAAGEGQGLGYEVPCGLFLR